jgi:hypothetical protein
LKEKLGTMFFFEPAIRLPFTLFSAWVQLEIHEGNHVKAEEILKTYISKSTQLADPKLQRALSLTDNKSLLNPNEEGS